VLSRRDYRTTGAMLPQPIRSQRTAPAVLMKPQQIVRAFTYRGTVPDPLASWPELRTAVRELLPQLSAPPPGCTRLCAVCRGPAGPGGPGAARAPCCYQCALHRQLASGSLADLVAPVSFAIKGSQHATRLWQYKSPRLAGSAPAAHATALRAMLLVFLRDHGRCLWRAAGITRPALVAAVPTGRGRPGTHPLAELVRPYLALPWAELTARAGGDRARDLDPARFSAASVPAASVLLIDDTWTTGSSAQSAAMALRAAGARSVVTVVLGRHVGAADARTHGVGPGAMPFLPDSCAFHQHRSARSRP
jgi:hypothetical protein